jgi:hypothetical protein
MGKTQIDQLSVVVAERDALLAEKKVASAQLFKIKQKVEAYFAESQKLREQLKGLDRPVNTVIDQLKEEARKLRLELIDARSESLKFQRERDAMKVERDAALAQLKKLPIEQAAAAPQAP